jgi:hypothetical protein
MTNIKAIYTSLFSRHMKNMLKNVENFELNRNDFLGIKRAIYEIDNFINRLYLSFILPIYDFTTKEKV